MKTRSIILPGLNSICNIALLMFSIISVTRAQVITTDPYFPLQTGPVTITFYADKGNAGLKDFSGEVYAHTGVITTASTSASDWKYVKTSWGQNTPETKLTKISANIYQLVIPVSIDAYYGLPGGTKVLKLAFVFRSGTTVNGSYKEGKETNGEDIFAEIFNPAQGLQTLLLSPGQNNFVSTTGTHIPVHAVSTLPCDLNFYINGSLAKSVDDGTDLTYDLLVGTAGTYKCAIISSNNTGDSDTLTFNFVVLGAPEVVALPAGSKLGLNRLPNQTFRFVLEAPGKNTVFWLGDLNDWTIDNSYRMKVTPDNRYFWIELDKPAIDQYVTYQYLVDESLIIADPLSELVLDPNQDGFLLNNIFTDLPAYPYGKTSQIASTFWSGDINYNWQVLNFQRPAKANMVIYELLVRDFLEDHDYASLLDTLDYLQKLGITALELMPPNEFEGNNSWGYNVSFHNAIDKYYGDPNKLKALIDGAHQRGIAVIFDVVFNHAFGQSPLARLYWDAPNNRPAADNPWLNPVAKHPFNVGYDFNHESLSTQAYMDRCIERMIEEFKVDGFRFDLSKGFTQVFSTSVDVWNQYDASRVALLKRLADKIWTHGNDIYVCLEHLGNNDEEKVLADYGMMLWGKMTDPYNEATMGYPADLSWSSYKLRGWNNPNLIVYMESHDEERLMVKNILYGNSLGAYNTKDPITALERMGMGMSVFLTIPGPKMIWEFGELGYNYSINTCTDGTVNNNCRLDPKPIRWDFLTDVNRVKLFNAYADLLFLKRTMPAFKTTDFLINVNAYLKTVVLKDPDADAILYANANVAQGNMTGVFTKPGTWYEYFSGQSLNITKLDTVFVMNPGEYRLYLSKNITRPTSNDIVVGTNEIDFPVQCSIFPNPSDGQGYLRLNSEHAETLQIGIYTLSGQLVKAPQEVQLLQGISTQIPVEVKAGNGLYFVRIFDGANSKVIPWIIQP